MLRTLFLLFNVWCSVCFVWVRFCFLLRLSEAGCFGSVGCLSNHSKRDTTGAKATFTELSEQYSGVVLKCPLMNYGEARFRAPSPEPPKGGSRTFRG